MPRGARTFRWLVAAAALSWVGLQLAATVLSRDDSWAIVTGPVYLAGALLCHQLSERSFHVGVAQWPVCARCAGIYVGAAAAALVSAVAPLRALETGAVAHARLLLCASVLPSAGTLLYEWTTDVAPANGIRGAAGLVLGAIVAWVVVAAGAPRKAVEVH
jgi:uncharacterized membrane protein